MHSSSFTISAYIHIYMYMHIYIHVCMYIHVYVYTHTCVCVYTCMHTYAHTFLFVGPSHGGETPQISKHHTTYLCTLVCINVFYVSMCECVYICTCAHKFIPHVLALCDSSMSLCLYAYICGRSVCEISILRSFEKQFTTVLC